MGEFLVSFVFSKFSTMSIILFLSSGEKKREMINVTSIRIHTRPQISGGLWSLEQSPAKAHLCDCRGLRTPRLGQASCQPRVTGWHRSPQPSGQEPEPLRPVWGLPM